MTPAVATQLAAHGGAGIGKVQVSLAPSVGNAAGVQVIYANIEGTGGNFPIVGSPYTNFLGIFETQDQGVTWTFQGTGPTSAGGVCQCNYTNTLAVDPGLRAMASTTYCIGAAPIRGDRATRV